MALLRYDDCRSRPRITTFLPDVVPRLVVSGVNLARICLRIVSWRAMGAAREAGLYGMPAIASSSPRLKMRHESAVKATVELLNRRWKFYQLCLKILGVQRDLAKPHISRWPIIEDEPAWSSNPAEALRMAFRSGELMLNINTPPTGTAIFRQPD